MRKSLTTIVGASVLFAALSVAPVLHADEGSSGMPMMGGGSMMGGPGAMMGMMNMMGQMGQTGQMAQNCNATMTNMMTDRGMAPNRQWRQDEPPATP
ncbi:MAG: hypothetical protein ACREED_03070 [Stellaceae bacterium]